MQGRSVSIWKPTEFPPIHRCRVGLRESDNSIAEKDSGVFLIAAAVRPMSNAIDEYRGYKAQQEQQLQTVQEATIGSSENLCRVLEKYAMV